MSDHERGAYTPPTADAPLSFDPRQPGQTATAYIVDISKGETPAGSMEYQTIFAVGLLLFQLASLANRHVVRDLHIGRAEWSPRHIWDDIKMHARLRLPTGEAARRYNTLQKISYVAVIFILLPLMIFTGLTMSPGIDAGWPWLLDIFGGRQSARSIHFICAFLLVAFVVVHLAMVVLAGPVNEIRSMITGWYRLPRSLEDEQ